MIRTVVSGILAIAIAVAFFGVVLLKIHEPVLWIVVGIGILMMIWNVVDGVREARDVHTADDTLPEGQQQRGGVS